MQAPNPQTCSLLGLYTNTSSPACDFETPLKSFGSPYTLILYATTSIKSDLEIFQGITPVEDFRAFGYKTLDLQKRHNMHSNIYKKNSEKPPSRLAYNVL